MYDDRLIRASLNEIRRQKAPSNRGFFFVLKTYIPEPAAIACAIAMIPLVRAPTTMATSA